MMHQISANTRLCRVCIWPRPLSAFSSFPSLWLQWMPQNMWWRQPLKLRKFHEYGCAWKWGRPIPHPTSHLDGNMIHHWILGPWPIFRHTNMTARFLRWQVTLVFSKVVTKRVQQPAIFARFWAPREMEDCASVCVCLSRMKFYQEMECDICFEHFKAWFFGCQDHFIALNSIVETSCLHVPGIHNEPLASMTLYLILD